MPNDNTLEHDQAVSFALAAHWQAKRALAEAKDRELQTRTALADILCKDSPTYVNKTMALSNGEKMVLSVKRDIRTHIPQKEVVHIVDEMVQQGVLTEQQLASFVRKKTETKLNAVGFNSLPDVATQRLSDVVSVVESVSINYNAPTEDR